MSRWDRDNEWQHKDTSAFEVTVQLGILMMAAIYFIWSVLLGFAWLVEKLWKGGVWCYNKHQDHVDAKEEEAAATAGAKVAPMPTPTPPVQAAIAKQEKLKSTGNGRGKYLVNQIVKTGSDSIEGQIAMAEFELMLKLERDRRLMKEIEAVQAVRAEQEKLIAAGHGRVEKLLNRVVKTGVDYAKRKY